MSRRWKIVHEGEWVRVRNLFNSRFQAAGVCELCRRLSCRPVWYSLTTRRVRCCACWSPNGEWTAKEGLVAGKTREERRVPKRVPAW